MGDTTSLVPGFPIRTSSDQRSVDSSPRLIAASYVLHRLPVPRHPPCALKHLQHKTEIRNCTSTPTKNPPPTTVRSEPIIDARCSQPLSTNQTPHPTTKMERHQTQPPEEDRATPPVSHHRDEEVTGLLSQSPIVCLAVIPETGTACLSRTRTTPTTGAAHPTNPFGTGESARCGPAQTSWCSLERR